MVALEGYSFVGRLGKVNYLVNGMRLEFFVQGVQGLRLESSINVLLSEILIALKIIVGRCCYVFNGRFNKCLGIHSNAYGR